MDTGTPVVESENYHLVTVDRISFSGGKAVIVPAILKVYHLVSVPVPEEKD